MCLQDLRIQAGMRVEAYSATFDGDGKHYLTDLRTAMLVWGVDDLDGFTLAVDRPDGGRAPIPADAEYSGPIPERNAYSRKCFSGFGPGTVYIVGTAGEAVTYFIHRYDAGVDHAVSEMLAGGLK